MQHTLVLSLVSISQGRLMKCHYNIASGVHISVTVIIRHSIYRLAWINRHSTATEQCAPGVLCIYMRGGVLRPPSRPLCPRVCNTVIMTLGRIAFTCEMNLLSTTCDFINKWPFSHLIKIFSHFAQLTCLPAPHFPLALYIIVNSILFPLFDRTLPPFAGILLLK